MFSEGGSGGAAKMAAVLRQAAGAARDDMLAVVRASAAAFLPLDQLTQAGPLQHVPAAAGAPDVAQVGPAVWQPC